MARYLIGNVKGPKGDDGISPTASVTQTENGATIRITDASGVTTAEITNGRSGSYVAGDNVQIVGNVINATDTTYTAGENIIIDGNNRISAIGGVEPVYYTAGEGIDITSNVISSTVVVPTKVSDLTNDENFVSNSDVLNMISSKQNTLTAGNNITITNDTISATNTTYTAGTGLHLNNGAFSADTTVLATKADIAGKQDTLTAGDNISISSGVISATNTTYTAGTGIAIENGEIRSTVVVPTATSDLTNDSGFINQTELTTALAAKQDTLTAGTGISINNSVISATGGSGPTYTAGDGIEIDSDIINVIVDGTTIDFDGDGQLTIGSDVPDKNYVDRGLNAKQDTLTAGSGIDITNNVISATGGGNPTGYNATTATQIGIGQSNHVNQSGFAIGYGNTINSTGNIPVVLGRQNSTSGSSGEIYILGQGNSAGYSSVVAGKYLTVPSDFYGDGTFVGRYNDTTSLAYQSYPFVVGVGSSSSNRKNGMTIDNDGNTVVLGKLTVGTAPTNNMDVATKKYVDDNAGGGSVSDPIELTGNNSEAAMASADGFKYKYYDGTHEEPFSGTSMDNYSVTAFENEFDDSQQTYSTYSMSMYSKGITFNNPYYETNADLTVGAGGALLWNNEKIHTGDTLDLDDGVSFRTSISADGVGFEEYALDSNDEEYIPTSLSLASDGLTLETDDGEGEDHTARLYLSGGQLMVELDGVEYEISLTPVNNN